YLGHRFMHEGRVMRRRHALHHKNRRAQGWFGELLDYATPGLPGALVLGGLIRRAAGDRAIGLGFLGGATSHMIFAAYAHQVQHERPELVFWMRKPVHHLHHHDQMWRHNFGISTDVWD